MLCGMGERVTFLKHFFAGMKDVLGSLECVDTDHDGKHCEKGEVFSHRGVPVTGNYTEYIVAAKSLSRRPDLFTFGNEETFFEENKDIKDEIRSYLYTFGTVLLFANPVEGDRHVVMFGLENGQLKTAEAKANDINQAIRIAMRRLKRALPISTRIALRGSDGRNLETDPTSTSNIRTSLKIADWDRLVIYLTRIGSPLGESRAIAISLKDGKIRAAQNENELVVHAVTKALEEMHVGKALKKETLVY